MAGSTVKGVVTGLLIGVIARKVQSLAFGAICGLAIGAFLAFLVALTNHYYWQMMLPGATLGLIVGFATFKYAERPKAVRA